VVTADIVNLKLMNFAQITSRHRTNLFVTP